MAGESTKLRPIYLHSSWRSSSTYVWAKFRERPETYCYFEPLAEQLAVATEQSIAAFVPWSYAHHPPLENPYQDEYRPLLRPYGGVRDYPHQGPYARYRLNADDGHPDMVRYFRTLEAFAESKGTTPVFGLVRSALRLAWFRMNFPGVHVVIVRNPRRQFLSCLHQMIKGTSYFIERGTVILGNNLTEPVLGPMADLISLPEFEGEPHLRSPYYAHLARKADPATHYMIFYYLHLAAMRSLYGNCDWLIDVDRLAEAPTLRAETEQRLEELTGLRLSFADCQPKSYDDLLVDAQGFFGPVEDQVERLLDSSMARV